VSPIAENRLEVVSARHHPLSHVANLEDEREALNLSTVAWSRIDEPRSFSESSRALCRV
jgi:hypothetical protein